MKNINKLLACLGVTVACLTGISQSAYAAVAGHVQFVNGDVQITNPAGQTRPAQKGDAVNEGDTLTSAPSASAQIKMQDGGFVAVRADTKLKFDQFIFAGKQDGNEKSFFSLFKGGFRAVTGLIGQINKQNYKITTPAATIGIRGTDHETFLIVPGSPLAQIAPSGAYNKVNVGETSLTTDRGTINVLPNQMGFAGGMNQAPQLQPVNTKVFTVAEAATPEAKAEKKEEKKEEKAEAKQEQAAKSDKEEKQEEKKEGGKEGGGDSKQADKGNGEATGDTQEAKQEGAAAESKPASAEQAASTSTGQASDTAAAAGGSQDAAAGGATQGTTTAAADTAPAPAPAPAVVIAPQEPAPIRVSAVVDAVPPSAGLIQAPVSPVIAAPTVVAPVIAPPPAPTTVVNTAPTAGGITVNLATGTATTNTGQVITITQGLVATQAQTAADAALLAANAAQTAATTATGNNTTLAAVAQVSTAPAITAIGTATTNIGTASTAVTVATAINLTATLATATANATTAQTAATSAAAQALAAQNALTANATFADATAGSANTATQNANGSLQTANATVQTEAGNVSVQNTALTTAQGAASTALASANNNWTTANNSLNTANAQNAAIVTAQGSTATPLTAAQTAADNAQAAATAAQAAATQAASLQAAGDLAGAQAQLLIAQQKQVFAEQQLVLAQAAQTTTANQLAAAQTAAAAASTAVTAATSAANTAATAAGTGPTGAQTYAAAAQTAATSAGSALTTTSNQLVVVNTNAPIVATNAPIAAYNNPNILSLPGASHNLMAGQPVTGGWLEVWNTNYGVLNTQYVLDGNKNLVEMRSAGYSTYDQTLPVQGILNANVKFAGGVARDTYVAPDSSIYMGRWQGGGITVTDTATAQVAPFTTNLGASSAHWVIGQMVPETLGVSLVQSLVGKTNYTMSAFTKPTDSFGNVGTVTNATLSADFTAQTVASTATFTFSTNGPVNSSAKNQVFTINQTAMPIINSGFNDSWPAMTTTVGCSGADCGTGTWSAWLYGDFAGATASSAYVDYALFNRANSVATAGGVHTDMVQSIIAFNTAIAPAPATNPPAGTWESFSHLAVGSAGVWQRGRFNMGALPPQPNTSFILDGAGNLVSSLHVNYNERTTWQSGPAVNAFSDATVTYSGGVASDRYTTPDGSLTIGRWTGGQLTIADNLSATTLVQNLGVTSAYWALGSASAMTAGYVQSLVGTTTYTQGGATLPTDTFGNVGSVPVATLSANFTNQTIAASVAFTIAAQNLTVTATGVPIVTTFFDATLETFNAPTVACTGAGCSGGSYLGWMTGAFNGATASSADLAYKIWPTAAPGSLVNDIIQGIVAFSAGTAPTVLTGGPFAAYVPSGVTVALSSLSSGGSQYWDSFTAAPADIAYTGGLPSGFTNRWGCPGCGESNTTTVLGAASPISALATSNATTGIKFGRWTTSTAIEHSYATQLGTKFGAPDSWMYGPQGYLDTNYIAPASGYPTSAMAATFSYALDGASAPYDRDTGLNGTLTSATLTANFTAMTVNAALGLSMPGGKTWAANVANQPVYGNSFSAYANAGGAVNTLAVTRNGAACPTCGGNLQGGFTGQNYAGAILSYQLYDHAASGDVVGNAALTRTGVVGNPVVVNATPVAPINYFVADYGGSLQWVDAITATSNLLTGYSNGTPGTSGYSSTTVTCTTCTTAATGDVANSGIYFGTWQAGSWTNTWGSNISPGQFHWITGPEAGPVYLPEVLTSTVTYTLDGGTTPTNLSGTAGTLNTATLTVNFTKQVVGISLSALVAGNTWNAGTTAGNEAPLDYNTSLGRTAFYASSYQGGGPGTLTVSVSNVGGTLSANGWVSGNLTGSGLTGAVLSYNLNGSIPTASFQSWDQINGVAAFVAPTSDIAAPYRMVGVALTDLTAAVPLPGMASLYNAASRVTSDVTGNLTKFDISPVGSGSANSLTVAQGTSALANFGSDPLTGISWGRWQGGVIDVTDRATSVVKQMTLQGSAHWLAGPTMTAPVTLPVSGTFTYTLAGNTSPTDNLGVAGMLNSATLSANFTAQTVDVGVRATVNATTLGASATGVPIMQGAAFGAGGNMGNTLAVTCAGTCGAVGSHGGVIAGGFTGAGATGAGMMYSLGTGLGGAGATVISGVAAFQRGAIPQ